MFQALLRNRTRCGLTADMIRNNEWASHAWQMAKALALLPPNYIGHGIDLIEAQNPNQLFQFVDYLRRTWLPREHSFL